MWTVWMNRRTYGLALALLSASWLNAPAWAGQSPAGSNSGVTTSGSAPLTTGAAPISSGGLSLNSPNIDLDLATGELILTAAARQSLDAEASRVLQELRSQNPALATILSQPTRVVLGQLVEDVEVDNCSSNVPRATCIAEEVATPGRTAEAVAAAIAAGELVNVFAENSILKLSEPRFSGDQTQVQLSYIATPGATPLQLTLEGSIDQVTNAAAYSAAVVAAGGSPAAVRPFIRMALAGVPYEEVVALTNATAGLLASGASSNQVSATQLNEAILTYNRLLNSLDDATLLELSQDGDFTALGSTLRRLRTAIDA